MKTFTLHFLSALVLVRVVICISLPKGARGSVWCVGWAGGALLTVTERAMHGADPFSNTGGALHGVAEIKKQFISGRGRGSATSGPVPPAFEMQKQLFS